MPWDYSDASDYDGPSRLEEYRAERRATRRCLRPCDEDGCPTDEDEGSDDTTEDEGEE
jgi:hypothetical protein